MMSLFARAHLRGHYRPYYHGGRLIVGSTRALGVHHQAFPILKDDVIVGSDDFKRNKELMDSMVHELETNIADAREGVCCDARKNVAMGHDFGNCLRDELISYNCLLFPRLHGGRSIAVCTSMAPHPRGWGQSPCKA